MVTMEQIKTELANIRYYYSRKETFAKAFDSVGKNGILDTVSRYNQIICSAPPRESTRYTFASTLSAVPTKRRRRSWDIP